MTIGGSAIGEITIGQISGLDGVAPGGVIQVDITVIPGGATASSSSMGRWGPPKPYLYPGYRVPTLRRDALAHGAQIGGGVSLVAGGARAEVDEELVLLVSLLDFDLAA